MTDNTQSDVVEAHGEALHALSAALLANGAFESDEVHGFYERVVNTFKALDASLSTKDSDAVLEERERCARIAEDRYLETDWQEPGQRIAAAIRKGDNA